MKLISLLSFFVQPARILFQRIAQFLAIMISLIVNEHFRQSRVGRDDFFRSINWNLDLRTDVRFHRFYGIGPIRESLIGMVEAGEARREKWLEKMRALGRKGG
jgi:hypothetical protein